MYFLFLQPTWWLLILSSPSLCGLFGVLSAVYNWHSEGEGHKRVHLAAWWCAELCQEAPSDVPAGATFRRTPPFVQEDHRLYTHGCTHDPRLGWTNISCIIYGHRSVWMSSVVWHLCITLPFDSWLKRQKFSLGLVFYWYKVVQRGGGKTAAYVDIKGLYWGNKPIILSLVGLYKNENTTVNVLCYFCP